MTDTFEEYKVFENDLDARECIQILEKHDIPYIVEKTTQVFDPAFAGNTNNDCVVLKLAPEDFLKADSAMVEGVVIEMDTIDRAYYLFDFSDAKLFEVIGKKDEWSEFDFVLAQKILKERGKNVSPELVMSLQNRRLEELSRKEPFPHGWIKSGYSMAFMGGFGGIIIGIHLYSSSKILPNGKKIYIYENDARIHGLAIILIGVIILIIVIYFKLKEQYEKSL